MCDAADGGAAGSGFSVGQDLCEKSPKHDGGAINRGVAEGTMFSKDRFYGAPGLVLRQFAKNTTILLVI